jgi:hypothetical protein
MQYPCIVYEWDEEALSHANNNPYMRERRYRLTIIDEDPTSGIPGLVGDLPKCSFSRFYRVQNLNHTVYKLYF